jgi:mono/diheme cytochrome c family protein
MRWSGALAAFLVLGAAPLARADEGLSGGELFAQNCAVCHGADGHGQSALAPPLTSYPGKYLATPAGRRQLADTVLYGMFGDVVVEGRHYNFKMPEFSRESDANLARVLNFVAQELAHASEAAKPLAPEELGAARAEPKTGAEVRGDRIRLLEALGL